MQTKWVDKEFVYDGSQLRSLFAYLDFNVMGDSIVSWIGPCDISFENMVDGEDKLAKATIEGARMLHFVFEKFSEGIAFSVAAQRLISSIAKDLIVELSPKDCKQLLREGDDLYWAEKKASISIATVSPVSAMVHFAINVTNEKTPVETCSLEDFEVDPVLFAKKLLERLKNEFESMEIATKKVHWVK